MQTAKIFYLDEVQNTGILKLDATSPVLPVTPSNIHGLDSQELDHVARIERILVLGIDAWSKLSADKSFSDIIDPTTEFEVIKRGYVGNVLGYQIHVSLIHDPNLVSLTLLYVNRDNQYEVLGYSAFRAE